MLCFCWFLLTAYTGVNHQLFWCQSFSKISWPTKNKQLINIICLCVSVGLCLLYISIHYFSRLTYGPCLPCLSHLPCFICMYDLWLLCFSSVLSFMCLCISTGLWLLCICMHCLPCLAGDCYSPRLFTLSGLYIWLIIALCLVCFNSFFVSDSNTELYKPNGWSVILRFQNLLCPLWLFPELSLLFKRTPLHNS